MQKKRKRKKVQSLRSVSLKLLIPIGIAVVGLLAFLILGLAENQRLADNYVKDTAELYVDKINRDIRQMNSEMVYVLDVNKDIAILPERLQPEDAQYYEAFQSIQEQNRILRLRYSEVQFFYVYNRAADVMVTDCGVVFPDSLKSTLQEALIKQLKAPQAGRTSAVQWTLLHTQDEDYMVSWYTKHQMTMGCVINVAKIFEILQEGVCNYQAIPFMKDLRGQILLPEGISERHSRTILNDRKKENLYSFQLGSIGQIHLYVVPGSGMLDRILKVQILFVVLITMLLVLCVVIAYSYYEKIMAPMRTFVEGLDHVDEEQMLGDDGTNNILELEFASGRFRTLLRKIQSLKIAVYEKELKEQQTELEYVQEQMRPHFLLNCLSVIHGMADEKGEGEIVHITEVLSEYMRYVMRDSKNRKVVREELAHVASYVEIQKLRYGEDAFSYEVILDGDVEECLVLPLLIQTLVENSVVHGVTLDSKVEISLYITRENYEDGPYLYISVSDTGKGFRDETLEALENDGSIIYNGRKHVGLQNVRRRLELMYGGRAGITFSNMGENYGAVVEVHLPIDGQTEPS